METVLISGATGFVGKNLLERFLLEKKFNVFAYALPNDSKGIDFLNEHGVHYITSLNAKEIEKTDYCIHLASYGLIYGARDIETMLDANVKFSALLAEFCAKRGCKLFINTGSCLEYGSLINDRAISEKDPLTPDDIYAASKVACEDFLNVYCKVLNLKLLTIRPFSMFGKYDNAVRIVPSIFEAGYNKKHVSLTGCEQIRDYMDVKDVALAIHSILCNANKIGDSKAINICSGTPLKLRDFIENIADSCGFDHSLFGFGEKEYRSNESLFFAGDNSLLLSIIGPHDFSMSEEKIRSCYADYVSTRRGAKK